MSGIFGIINLNQAPVAEPDLSAMAETLKQRGPDGQSLWRDGAVGLGHALLATTPSALFEHLPLRDAASGCVITADARIDNREELMVALGIDPKGKATGDAELILRSYLKWGHDCPQQLMGDFAFAIWNPRNRELFCARDHFGIRPFIYHHAAGKFFVFASSVPAVLSLKQVPKKINEARIADFLHNLESIDTVSTCYENVYRLSPAHSLCVSERGMEIERYWSPQPGPMFNLPSDADYVEAFLEVFSASVKSRLVTADSDKSTLGSMLSGGMDSGAVVAIVSRMFADKGFPSLKTFSAVGPDPENCLETRSIHAAIGMGNIDSQAVNYAELNAYLDELRRSAMQVDEPFDGNMNLIRAVYLAAHRKGVKVMLDGVAGDSLLLEGSQTARLIRSGHWLQAFSNEFGLKHFYGNNYPVWQELYKSARYALIPNWARRLKRGLSSAQPSMPPNLIINSDFARRIDLPARIEQYALHYPTPWLPYAEERSKLVCHSVLVNGRERYNRVASAFGVEPRDPFLDRRMVEFCLRLPGRQLQVNGWPKFILRQAMVGKLPDNVIWKLGRQHLGVDFTAEVFVDGAGSGELSKDDIQRLSLYLAPEIITNLRNGGMQEWLRRDILFLAFWLRENS